MNEIPTPELVHDESDAPTPSPEQRRSLIRRVARTAVGGTIVLAGIAMLVLPGPGLLVVAAGLAVLARDVAWAARTLEQVRERHARASAAVRRRRR